MASLNLIICFISFIITVFSILLFFLFPIILDNQLDNKLVLKQNTELFDNWSDIKIPIFIKFYFFEVKNAEKVEFEGAEPILAERGPYTFLEKRNKIILDFENEGTEIKFVETKKYFFQPELSIGKLSDSLCLPNIPLLLMASKAVNDDSEDAGLFYDVIDAMIKKFDPPMFENHSVEEFLFKGYKVEIFEELKNLMETFKMDIPNEIKEAVFGLFYKKNGTIDKTWKVNTGYGKNQIFQVQAWNDSKYLSYWKTHSCNKIQGSDGSGFKKHTSKKDKLFLFDPGLCKPAELVFDKQKKTKNLLNYRFKLSEKLFSSIVKNKENECYCTRPERAKQICKKNGVFDLSGCLNGAPLVLSYPHFLNADLDLLKTAKGLDPQRSLHSSYIDVEPLTGIVINASKKIQFNIEIFRNETLQGFKDVISMVLPIAWIDEYFEADNKTIEDLIYANFLKNKLNSFIIFAIGLFTIIFVITFVFFLSEKNGKMKIFETNN